MSIAYITEQYLTDIANAIRKKTGITDTITPDKMGKAIDNIDIGAKPLFHINITQSDNQTITCTGITAKNPTYENGIVEITPDMFTANFSVIPATGYSAGTLSETNHNFSSWNEIVNITATAATKATATATNKFTINKYNDM